ncbi:MAG TPA: ABC transporter permease [Beutenbergiaceae bacterium]|nr:ABC transporter permease [Beutenbergiaceae bacterium]
MRGIALTSTGIVYLVLLAAVVVGVILTAQQGRNFFSTGNITAILTATSVLGLIAVGQTLVILGASLDLSVPFVVSLASVVGGGLMAGQAQNIPVAVVATLAAGAGIGLVIGLIVAFLDVHGFIATLGVGLIISGYLGSNYRGSHGSAPVEFQYIGATRIGPVPLSTFILLGVAVLAMVLLRRTRVGHHLYAVGGNRDVARLSGVHTARSVVTAHVLCSTFAAMAGLLLLSRMSVGSPTVGSQGGYDLMSIAAVVIGGTVLAGGKGNVLGTLGGVAIFAVLNNVMGVMEVNAFVQDMIRGGVIIAAVAVYARRSTDRRPARFERQSLTDQVLTEAR